VESGETLPMESIEQGGTSWSILSPERYGEKYDHPAFYNLQSHQVLDSSEDSQVGDWILLNGREYLDMLYYTPQVPIVETHRFEEGSFMMSGEIRSSGDSEIIEFGFMASTHLDMRNPILIPAELDRKSLEFGTSVEEIHLHGRIYYQAYAVNDAGLNHGSTKTIEISEEAHPKENVRENLEWFGDTMMFENSDWVFHSKLHWLYARPDSQDGLWLWKPDQGWLWTHDRVWPFLYHNETGGWLYLVSTEHGKSFFFDYEEHQYIPAIQEE